jgi:4a-hydroxytetrahydrobiopterin dehydratase
MPADRRPLSAADLDAALRDLPEWSRSGESIVRSFRFTRFADGIAFVSAVAAVADEMDHHPDIDIRFTTVRMALSTHDAGGVTALDVRLAARIDDLYEP